MYKPLFPLGQVVATPGAIDVLAPLEDQPQGILDRHIQGDWGEVCEQDKRRNIKDENTILRDLRHNKKLLVV